MNQIQKTKAQCVGAGILAAIGVFASSAQACEPVLLGWAVESTDLVVSGRVASIEPADPVELSMSFDLGPSWTAVVDVRRTLRGSAERPLQVDYRFWVDACVGMTIPKSGDRLVLFLRQTDAGWVTQFATTPQSASEWMKRIPLSEQTSQLPETNRQNFEVD